MEIVSSGGLIVMVMYFTLSLWSTAHKKTKHQIERLRKVIRKNVYKKVVFPPVSVKKESERKDGKGPDEEEEVEEEDLEEEEVEDDDEEEMEEEESTNCDVSRNFCFCLYISW